MLQIKAMNSIQTLRIFIAFSAIFSRKSYIYQLVTTVQHLFMSKKVL